MLVYMLLLMLCACSPSAATPACFCSHLVSLSLSYTQTQTVGQWRDYVAHTALAPLLAEKGVDVETFLAT